MKMILTRHGETEENILGIIQGHLPGKLTKKGIEQAKKLAKRLEKEHIDYIYSSDLARAADTAKEIAKYHPDVPIEFTKDMREKYLGSLQGKTKAEIGWKKEVSRMDADDGETRKEVYDRAKRFLDKIITKHKDQTVLLVGHNGINKAINSVIIGNSPEDVFLGELIKNTSISIYELDEDKKHKIHLFNCIKHLE